MITGAGSRRTERQARSGAGATKEAIMRKLAFLPIIAALAFLLWSCGGGEERSQESAMEEGHQMAGETQEAMAAAIDPVCSMKVDTTGTPLKVEHAGHTYYFCSEYCQEQFAENPAEYLKAAQEEPQEP
ncbi:MAG: YHS domain-containing protein [Candidatus Eisenbacteria bacterium]|nr:YHS domain-containing protein [Candidatus Eisenbacteria bacterium]